jgi:Glycosyltransferase
MKGEALVKVYINGRFLTQKVTGVQRYAQEMVKALDRLLGNAELNAKYEFIILVPKGIINQMNLMNIRIKEKGLLKGHLWEQIELPLYVGQHVLINLCNVGPVLKRNQLVTVHDASVYLENNNFSRLFRFWYKCIYKLELQFSKKIVTVSNFSRDELIKYTKVNPQKLVVVYEGHEHVLKFESDQDILIKNKLLTRPYALAVGSMDPRKNFKNINKAMDQLKEQKYEIVIAGGMNTKIFGGNEPHLRKNVKYLGYVSDEELRALYEHAFCFIYPSLYEGFGLPPLEAMALKCPVIVSDRASLPEICGEAAVYCDPTNPEDIAQHVNQLFNNQDLREYYKREGEKRANLFTWVKCSQKILETVNQI